MAANTLPIAQLPAAADAADADADMDASILSAGGIKPPAPAPAPAGASGKAPAVSKPKSGNSRPPAKKKDVVADSLAFKAKLDAAVREAERATRAKVEAEMAEKAAAAKRADVERAKIEVLKDQIRERDDEIAKYKSLVMRLEKADKNGTLGVEATKNQIFQRYARLFNPEEADYEEEEGEAPPPQQRLTDASGGKRAREEEEGRSPTDELPSHEEEDEEETKKKRRTRDPDAPKLAVAADKRWVAESMPKVYTAKGKESKEDPAFRELFILKTSWDGTWAARKEEKVLEDGTVLKPSIGCMALLAAYYKEHLAAEEKAPYEKAAAEDKARFDREMAAYKAAK